MPETSRRVAGGTRESTVRARQTTAAAAEHPPPRASASLAASSMNRRMPNGTYGGVGGGSRKAPTYPIERFYPKSAAVGRGPRRR